MTSPVLFFRDRFEFLQENVEKHVRGKTEAVRLALTCLFAQGHLLIEDVPGVAKTSLAKAIAGSIRGRFRRIQFTPDLLPSDLTGVEVFNPRTRDFEFREGPVFCNVLLGDEINRASPKTQSALLQVMAEREVTIALDTRPVLDLFFCVATQNPIEHRGTYLLPEAQLDRFLMRIKIGYPDHEDEMDVVADAVDGAGATPVTDVLSVADIVGLVAIARTVEVGDALRDYVVRIAAQTRRDSAVRLGISPRGTIALAAAAKVHAAAVGRRFATPDDVKAIAPSVLEHRLVLSPEAMISEATPADIVQRVLDTVPVPQRP